MDKEEELLENWRELAPEKQQKSISNLTLSQSINLYDYLLIWIIFLFFIITKIRFNTKSA